MADGVEIFIVRDVVRRIPVAEAVGENLVLHGAL